MAEGNVAQDAIGRPVKQGDYVFYYQNIYEVKDVLNNKSSKTGRNLESFRVKLFLVDPSPSSKAITRRSADVCLLPEKDVTLWLLRRSK